MKEFVISEVKAETAVLVGLITKDQDEAKTKEYLDEPEFADPDYLVLMISAETDGETLARLERVLVQIPAQPPIPEESPVYLKGEQVMTIREALLSDSEQLPAQQCLGRILAVPTVGCPPAVPILVCGERIDAHALGCFAYYGIDRCCVVKSSEENRHGV